MLAHDKQGLGLGGGQRQLKQVSQPQKSHNPTPLSRSVTTYAVVSAAA